MKIGRALVSRLGMPGRAVFRRRGSIALVSVTLLAVGLLLPSVVHPEAASAAGTFSVNSTADGHDVTPGNGVCETGTGNGICTLRAAIEESNALGGTNSITFSVNGTFTLSLGELHITGAPAQTLTITGSGQTTTIVDANKASRVLEIDSGAQVTLSGVTVRNGSTPNDGGGIRNAGGLQLSNSLVSSNSASATIAGGGGISNASTGTATLNLVTIDSNSSVGDGGGVETVGTLNFTNSTVSNNTATAEGGGIGIDGPTPTTTLTSLDIHDNTAAEGGGIVSSSAGTPITNVTLHANHAIGHPGGSPAVHSRAAQTFSFSGIGGGFASFSFGVDTLTNVTLDGNTAVSAGGGVADDSSSSGMKLVNVTIANNSASSQGGGLISAVGPDSLKYTILSANTPTNCATSTPGTIISGGQNVENGTSCGFVAPADKPATDPLLLSLASNPGPDALVPPTDALPLNSPAVDFSPAGSCPPPATDERGVSRPQGTACDSGAYELIQAAPPPRCDKDSDSVLVLSLDKKHHHHHSCRDRDSD